jgi:hypothetical protein
MSGMKMDSHMCFIKPNQIRKYVHNSKRFFFISTIPNLFQEQSDCTA